MRTRINCFEISDGSQTFQIITYKPIKEAVQSELKAVFKSQEIEFPDDIRWTFKYDNLMTATYMSTEYGKPERVRLNFNIEYI